MDEITKNFKIISQGHETHKELFLEDKNIIINTEHGPQGGDEININKLENNELIPDYGWPIFIWNIMVMMVLIQTQKNTR